MSQTPGQPDRVSTSTMLDASFHPGGGIDSIAQQGSVAYQDGERKAWGAGLLIRLPTRSSFSPLPPGLSMEERPPARAPCA